MKIVILDSKTLGNDMDLGIFNDFGEVRIWENTLPHERIAHIGDADIVIVNKVIIDRNIIDACSSVKLICLTATGMNNIDTNYASEKNIHVLNVADYSTDSVAQHTFTMLFYIISKPAYYDNYVKSGEYCKSDIFTHIGPVFFELSAKTFGIIGLGNIGKKVANIARSFGANVIYYSTSGQNNDSNFKRVSFEELLKTSDIISIHAPLNEKTKNLISLKELKMMKNNSVLINCGRGGIVNELDLSKALDENLIGAACLDVLSKEPPDSDSPLLNIINKEKLFITPHTAWISVEARKRLIRGVYDNIAGFLRKK